MCLSDSDSETDERPVVHKEKKKGKGKLFNNPKGQCEAATVVYKENYVLRLNLMHVVLFIVVYSFHVVCDDQCSVRN